MRGCGVGYGFAFNGQEKDDEISGEGNIMTAEFWEYDARLGRRWNVDPISKHSSSNFSCFSNNPLTRIDPNGKSDYYTEKGKYLGSDGSEKTDIIIITDKNLIKKINAQSEEVLKKNPDAYVEVKIELKENTYFILPSFKDRSEIKEKIEKVDYSDGKYYEIGGASYTIDGKTTRNDNTGEKQTLQQMAESAENNLLPLGVGLLTEGLPDANVNYTWHLHPDKMILIKDPITSKFSILAKDNSSYSGKFQTIGGLEPSSTDENNYSSTFKSNFLFTKTGEDVMFYDKNKNVTLDKKFFFNTQAKIKPKQ